MATSTDSSDGLSKEQLQRLKEVSGFRLDSGTPCTCDLDELSTTKKRGYSDSMIYYHECNACGNEYVTWIEG